MKNNLETYLKNQMDNVPSISKEIEEEIKDFLLNEIHTSIDEKKFNELLDILKKHSEEIRKLYYKQGFKDGFNHFKKLSD